MDAFEIRKKLIIKSLNNRFLVITSEDKFASKITKSLNFAYLIIKEGKITYIVHKAQDDNSISENEKIVTMDPEGTLLKIKGKDKIFSPHPDLLKNFMAEKIDLDSIFRKPYDDEITIIKDGAALLDKALENSVNNISIGMKEFEIKAEIDYAISKIGFESFSYPTVVLVGERSSIPLGRTGQRVLENGDIVQIDVSPIYKGYDLSIARIIFTEIDQDLKDLWKKYNKVFEIVTQYLRPGVQADKIDSITRGYISQIGYSYPHFSGYPLGGFTSPNIYPGSNDILERNSVFIFSPGLYVNNKFGFRIKRMVHITDNSFETLDKFGE